ncbi:MAG TPA: FliA/WhiG family RNA polymerase sigma factor [Vicinamibacterales bacterium]
MHAADVSYQERDRLVINHLALVRKVAVGLVRRLPAQVEMNELIGEGVVGLLDAARRYKPASGVPFEAFAARRVRGSMLDALRAVDTASRRTRRMERTLKATKSDLQQSLGREPLDSEVAEAMGLSRAAYARARRTVERAENSGFVAFEEAFGDDQRALAKAIGYVEEGPDVELERLEQRQLLEAALQQLPERERRVLSLYYDEELTMAEIAKELGLSESRISQLRSLALSRLRTALRGPRGPLTPSPMAARRPAVRKTLNVRSRMPQASMAEAQAA